ncbi:hypothetical protein WJX73_007930 [Symbiochloris irregularis]|uniref:RWD domain-containing protein n=1 Tax=Symbiochloris irregularis TaxID=706552 RepID=A0AAW1P4E7_9CHLO
MDYAAEQEMELEALEAILMEDLQPLQGSRPESWPADVQCHQVGISARDDGETSTSDTPPLELEFVFAHTPTYPDEPPLFKARSARGLSNQQLQQLHGILDEQVEQNIGMGMIYAMVSAAQEWIRDLAHAQAGPQELDPAAAKRQAAEEEEKTLAEIRAHGTPVTADTFAAWKARWDTEAALSEAKLEADAAIRASGPTGKQWFVQQEAAGAQAEELEENDEGEDSDTEFRPEEDEEEEEEFDDDDEDDMLETYLAQKT